MYLIQQYFVVVNRFKRKLIYFTRCIELALSSFIEAVNQLVKVRTIAYGSQTRVGWAGSNKRQ